MDSAANAVQGNISVSTIAKAIIRLRIWLGGIISFAEYEKGLREEQKKKIGLCSRLNKIEKENSYVLYRPEGDIEIEEGKTYLMYLDYNSDYEGYSFRFMEYGLREVKYIEEIYVLNNVTNEWENITEVI